MRPARRRGSQGGAGASKEVGREGTKNDAVRVELSDDDTLSDTSEPDEQTNQLT